MMNPSLSAPPTRCPALRPRLARLAAACLAGTLLAGCASLSADGGFGTVADLTQARVGQTPSHWRGSEPSSAIAQRVTELLAQPLSADSAVAIALLNNRHLQASYAELGIAEADLLRAGRLPNPTLSFGRLSGNGVVEIDRAVMFDVLGLLTMPLAKRVEQRRFEQAQLQAAYSSVGLAAEARRAYFDAVTAQQLLAYQGQVKLAAEASSELAQRMRAAGNFNALAQMREQAFHSEALMQLARAQHQAQATRERLARALGLAGGQLNFVLPDRLPDLPAAPTAPQDAEQTAMTQRLDVLMAKRSADATAQALGLTKTTRFINVLHLGYQNKSESSSAGSDPLASGYEIELTLPLFDWGTARTARAEASYLQALHRTAAIAGDARSEVREAYSAYRSAYDLARHHRDELLPLRKRISDENLLRYNGMFVSVFELLADAREQINSVTASVTALRDYWVAETHLQTAITGRSPGPLGVWTPAATTTAPTAGSAGH